MEQLKLIRPSAEYAEQILSYRSEFLQNKDSMDGTSSLWRISDVGEWLSWVDKLATNAAYEEGWIPDVQYLCIREKDNQLVGMIDIRLELNDYCARFAGQIGYSIRKSERRKGYAKEQLRLALEECRKLGFTRVLITCAKENEASRRTILAFGGQLDGEELDPSDGLLTQRYWVTVPPAA